jgi:hypothetical protein
MKKRKGILDLNKKTIANLRGLELNAAKGGTYIETTIVSVALCTAENGYCKSSGGVQHCPVGCDEPDRGAMY